MRKESTNNSHLDDVSGLFAFIYNIHVYDIVRNSCISRDYPFRLLRLTINYCFDSSGIIVCGCVAAAGQCGVVILAGSAQG